MHETSNQYFTQIKHIYLQIYNLITHYSIQIDPHNFPIFLLCMQFSLTHFILEQNQQLDKCWKAVRWSLQHTGGTNRYDQMS